MTFNAAITPYRVVPVTVMAGPPSIPDGDSVRLLAADLDLWPDGVRLSNGNGSVQIRAEGIDALELHFFGRHQPLRWAEAARDYLLKKLGVRHTERDHPKAWALTRSVDPYGRAITFVVPGFIGLEAGASLAVGSGDLQEAVKASLNYQLLSAGLVYPLFYENLPEDLLSLFRHAAIMAQEGKKGLWPEDASETGVVVQSEREVGYQVYVPKLYRRLVRYYGEGRREKGLGGLRRFLKKESDPLRLVVDTTLRQMSDKEILGIQENGNLVFFQMPQHDIIWMEKGVNPFLPKNHGGIPL